MRIISKDDPQISQSFDLWVTCPSTRGQDTLPVMSLLVDHCLWAAEFLAVVMAEMYALSCSTCRILNLQACTMKLLSGHWPVDPLNILPKGPLLTKMGPLEIAF